RLVPYQSATDVPVIVDLTPLQVRHRAIHVRVDPGTKFFRPARVLRVHRHRVSAVCADLRHRAGGAAGAVHDPASPLALHHPEHAHVLAQRARTDLNIRIAERRWGDGAATDGQLESLLRLGETAA